MLFIIILYTTVLGKAEPEMAKRETKERQTLPKAQDVSISYTFKTVLWWW